MNDLTGLTVVSLEQAVAAPFASSRLADAGARVIKVERPEGDFARGYDHLVDGESAYFVWLNRGKESIALDLKLQADRAVLLELVARADIFIQNLAPGACSRLGLGPETLCERHPRLIYCSVSGYGSDGPYRDQKAYDMLIQGESGLLAVTGTPEGSARVGISICDIASGANAFSAILLALIGRQQTGRGRHIEVSMFHVMADWMNVPYLQTRYGGKPPQRVGVRHPTIAPYGSFACADGRRVLMSIQNEREWANFCEQVLADQAVRTDPRFRTNVDRVANMAALEAIVATVFAGMDRETAIGLLSRAGIACGRLSDMDDLVAHPERQLMTVAGETGRPIEMLSPGVRVNGDQPAFGAVPALDAQGAAIRAEVSRSV